MQQNRRLIHVWAGIPLKEEEMGEVRVKVKLINAADEALVEAGHLTPERIRTVIVDALVDTGAVRSVIPTAVKEQLGLKTAFHTKARCADGRSEEVEVTTPIRMELEGRPLYEECLVLGDEVLSWSRVASSVAALACFGFDVIIAECDSAVYRAYIDFFSRLRGAPEMKPA